jgi:hypothetical protein
LNKNVIIYFKFYPFNHFFYYKKIKIMFEIFDFIFIENIKITHQSNIFINYYLRNFFSKKNKWYKNYS